MPMVIAHASLAHAWKFVVNSKLVWQWLADFKKPVDRRFNAFLGSSVISLVGDYYALCIW